MLEEFSLVNYLTMMNQNLMNDANEKNQSLLDDVFVDVVDIYKEMSRKR
jgi:hypothetical protein